MPSQAEELEVIYVRFVGPVRNYLHRLTGNRALAEEMTQEVFYRSFVQLARGVRVTYISSWLFRIARNLYLDHAKKKARQPASLDALDEAIPMDLTSPTHQSTPESQVLRRETWQRIIDALQALPEEQRTAVVLRDIEGLTYQEIADAMESSLSAAKVRVHRGRRKLAETYGLLEEGE